jgi:hypothetical protein
MCDMVLLHIPQWEEPFLVYTDTSVLGLGAGLYQPSPEVPRSTEKHWECPIAFISRQLRKGELVYGPTQLECLAIV